MLDETKQIIDQFYEPTRIELARILNDDKWLWNDRWLWWLVQGTISEKKSNKLRNEENAFQS